MLADDSERRQREDPFSILTSLGLGAGQTFVDVGSGGGYYSIPAAQIVGPEGHVYAIDINQESLDELANAARGEGLANVTLVHGRAEETVVCVGCADFVFYATALHDFDDPAAVLRNAHRMLKPQGRVVDLDWGKSALFGPPVWKRLSEAEVTRLMKDAGFESVTVKESGYYVISAVRGTGQRGRQ